MCQSPIIFCEPTLTTTTTTTVIQVSTACFNCSLSPVIDEAPTRRRPPLLSRASCRMYVLYVRVSGDAEAKGAEGATWRVHGVVALCLGLVIE
ncbi:hypothetical protein E2C01_015834 [Portunus trituberculatus]|uniref:Uncharacterized protein n=1 Tax=Portunus trituberculatus TaxID=210409 RepID=A0A5B7DNY4_PORTR|nr:hypothetical protein [Portunus trituberculatus]